MSESHGCPRWLDEATQEAKERIECLYQEGVMLISANRVDSHVDSCSGSIPDITPEEVDGLVPDGAQADYAPREGVSA
jgi:hypothetical protein